MIGGKNADDPQGDLPQPQLQPITPECDAPCGGDSS
jgi:hypothetical protein